MSDSTFPSRNLVWKRRLGSCWRFLPKSSSRRVVLIYHSVGGGPLSLPVSRFREQLDWMAVNAQVVSLEDLMETGKPDGRLRIALTFDDGYRTLADVVAPLLTERNWSAAVYLNTGHIGERERQPSQPRIGHYPGEEFLLWEEVEKLSGLSWIVGSHGIDHVDLTKLDAPEIDQQLTESRRSIENKLGRECRHFAYTWGRSNRLVRSMASANGYSVAVAAHHGAVLPHSDQMALPRIDVRREYDLSDFSAAVLGDWDFLGHYQRIKGALR